MILRTLMLSLLLAAGVATAAPSADEASAGSNTQAPQVEQRARAYLDALKAQDLHTAYWIQAGARDKSLSAAAFRRRVTANKAILLDYQIKEIAVESDQARVAIDATYQYPQLREPLSMPRTLQWVLIDGDWYLRTQTKQRDAEPSEPGS